MCEVPGANRRVSAVRRGTLPPLMALYDIAPEKNVYMTLIVSKTDALGDQILVSSLIGTILNRYKEGVLFWFVGRAMRLLQSYLKGVMYFFQMNHDRPKRNSYIASHILGFPAPLTSGAELHLSRFQLTLIRRYPAARSGADIPTPVSVHTGGKTRRLNELGKLESTCKVASRFRNGLNSVEPDE
jgi:hypothetical protein